MKVMWLLVIAAAAVGKPAPKPVSEEPSGRAVRFVLDPKRRVYDVNVAYSFTTTVWFPVDCLSAVVGDPETFAALINPRFKNRVIITPQLEARGASTNVTIDCAQEVRVVLQVTQTARDEAVQSVEFEFSPEEDARVRAVIAATEKRLASECDLRVEKAKEDVSAQAVDTLARGMLRRFKATEDVEYARSQFVIVKVFRTVLIGGRAFISFQVQNRTDKDVVIREVEVLDDKTHQPLDNATLVMPERRIGGDSISLAVVAFDSPEDTGVLTLVVREDGPRVIEVNDIDL